MMPLTQNTPGFSRLGSLVLAAAFALLICPAASGATGNPLASERADQWLFTLAFPMLWAPDVSVEIRGDRNEDIRITFEDILDGLDFGLMGEFYTRKHASASWGATR